MTGHHDTHPTQVVPDGLPPETVLLTATPAHAVPMRTPTGAWGMVVVAVHTTDPARASVCPAGDATDPARVVCLMAGVWLPAPPPAALHTGDVLLRLHPPTADDDPDRVDVEVLAATHGQWRSVSRYEAVDARWPHKIALPVLAHMRHLADTAYTEAQWATLTGPIAAALPPGLLPARLVAEPAGSAPRRRVPDALPELVEAGLLEVGEQIVWAGHTATVGADGVLHHGPHAHDVSTITALATHLCGCTVNGWHLWHRARDHRLLADLRTELTTR